MTTIDLIDILIVAYVVFRLMLILRGTRATSIIKGLGVILGANAVARYLGFRTVTWILTQGTTVILVALPVVFYPELRRALEHLGRGQLFTRLSTLSQDDTENVIDIVARAVRQLSQSRTGALITFEREVGLEEYIESGIRIEGMISPELILTIFTPTTPLHDGAIILRGMNLVAAGCFLPLTESPISSELGTRHRAAQGVSEVSDALVVVVSEETGSVSVAAGGQLHRNLDENALRSTLSSELSQNGGLLRGWFR
ncbi:MAG: diadenylate cyclase CdaA [Limnochordia bacterium]